jgi:mRNA interferase MazF
LRKGRIKKVTGGCATQFSTQVSVGIDEGLKHESWILCDNLVSLRRVQLTRFVGSLARSKVEELDQALKRALALE